MATRTESAQNVWRGDLHTNKTMTMVKTRASLIRCVLAGIVALGLTACEDEFIFGSDNGTGGASGDGTVGGTGQFRENDAPSDAFTGGQRTAAVQAFDRGTPLNCDASYDAFVDDEDGEPVIARFVSGPTEIFFGFRFDTPDQGQGRTPFVVRFDNQVQTFCKNDFETTSADSEIELLVFADNRLFVVLDAQVRVGDRTQQEANFGALRTAYRPFASGGWLNDLPDPLADGEVYQWKLLAEISAASGFVQSGTFLRNAFPERTEEGISVGVSNLEYAVSNQGQVTVSILARTATQRGSVPLREDRIAYEVCTSIDWEARYVFNESLNTNLLTNAPFCARDQEFRR